VAPPGSGRFGEKRNCRVLAGYQEEDIAPKTVGTDRVGSQVRSVVFNHPLEYARGRRSCLRPTGPQDAKRPKVGWYWRRRRARTGARRIIRWLEEHRIPVDYVAGTSMGGLVGGLYATGHDARQINGIRGCIDWPSRSSGSTHRSRIFRSAARKTARQFPTALELGLRGGFKLAHGSFPGHGVGLVISRVAAPYAELKSFD